MAQRESLYRGAARAADVSAVGTRIGALGPVDMTFTAFKRLSSSEREALLSQYGVSSKGTNKERYARLYAINR